MAHAHAHDHTHGHPIHSGDESRVLWATLITFLFLLVEAGGGLLAHSLTLLADAGHMLADTAALALAWYAFKVARKPVDARRSFGYHRFQVLAAFVNGATLLGLSLWIVVEAVERFLSPEQVRSNLMLAVAVLGLCANALTFYVLHGGDRKNLNLRGALLHVLGDILGSLAAVAAALTIRATGWMPIDPLLSVLVAMLIVRSAWSLVRQSGHILMEGTPRDLQLTEVRSAICGDVPEVLDVHHLHAWLLNEDHPMVTLHARVREGADLDKVLKGISGVMEKRFGIDHSTIQLEYDQCIGSLCHGKRKSP